MLNLYVERMIRERGTIMGLLKAENVNDSEFDEQVKVCGTVEREADCLPVGKYRVCIAKCKRLNRKMPYLVPMDEDVSASIESSKGLCVLDSSQCELCCKARHSHEFGDISAFTSLPCAMIQPGNGPFTMGRGSILVGEVHAPGYVLKSQPLFTTLYERIKKAVWRGHDVTLEIKEM